MNKENKNIADVDETVQHQEDPVTKQADEAEASQLRNLNAVRSSGINEDFAEYVSFEMNKLVDKDKDFTTALTEWIEANPQYKQPTTATGMRRGSSPASQMDGVKHPYRELNSEDQYFITASHRRCTNTLKLIWINPSTHEATSSSPTCFVLKFGRIISRSALSISWRIDCSAICDISSR